METKIKITCEKLACESIDNNRIKVELSNRYGCYFVRNLIQNLVTCLGDTESSLAEHIDCLEQAISEKQRDKLIELILDIKTY